MRESLEGQATCSPSAIKTSSNVVMEMPFVKQKEHHSKSTKTDLQWPACVNLSTFGLFRGCRFAVLILGGGMMVLVLESCRAVWSKALGTQGTVGGDCQGLPSWLWSCLCPWHAWKGFWRSKKSWEIFGSCAAVLRFKLYIILLYMSSWHSTCTDSVWNFSRPHAFPMCADFPCLCLLNAAAGTQKGSWNSMPFHFLSDERSPMT